jgi:peptidoglycan/LPS O-acetylase OafA/YrhL
VQFTLGVLPVLCIAALSPRPPPPYRMTSRSATGAEMKNDSLEGVRGAAALLVVVYHMHDEIPALAATRNGYLAVDLFFVLSGFVIAGAYAARLRDAREGFAFMGRRFARLWPAHIVASAVCIAIPAAACIVVHADPSHAIPTVREGVAIVTLSQGLGTVTRDIGTAVSWSASDEFYVYVLFAAACIMLRGRGRVAAFAVLALVGYAVAVWSSPASCAHDACYDLTFTWGWGRCLAGFFAGALIAEYCERAAFLRRRVPQVVAFAASVALFAFAHCVRGAAFAAPFVFAALVASLSADCGPVARVFQSRPAQYLGRLSYSLYLAHAPLRGLLYAVALIWASPAAHAVEAVVMIAGSLALATVLHRRVEAPCRERINAWVTPSRSASPSTDRRTFA